MADNSSRPGALAVPAVALAELLTTHPDLAPEASGLTWTLTLVGGIRAEATAAGDGGRAVDRCAQIMGGTPVRVSVGAGQDRVVVAELATTWHGVPVEVWATYPEPCPLGALVAPGGLRHG